MPSKRRAPKTCNPAEPDCILVERVVSVEKDVKTLKDSMELLVKEVHQINTWATKFVDPTLIDHGQTVAAYMGAVKNLERTVSTSNATLKSQMEGIESKVDELLRHARNGNGHKE